MEEGCRIFRLRPEQNNVLASSLNSKRQMLGPSNSPIS
jgi:hypothetical protein